MTSAFKRWGWVKYLVTAAVLAHLHGIPKKYDPVHYFGDGVYRVLGH